MKINKIARFVCSSVLMVGAGLALSGFTLQVEIDTSKEASERETTQPSSVNVGTPRHQGTEIDGTPWEWNGSNWSEGEAKQQGADLACQARGYKSATNFTVKTSQQKGNWRYHTDGRMEWCDFCQWYITNLECS